MSDVIDQLEALVERCKTHKIRATIDPRNLNPPCVIFSPPEIRMDLNCGGTASWQAIVVVPGPGNADAWKLLDRMAADLVDKVLPDVERITPGSFGVDEGANPALTLTWEGPVTFP